MASDLNPYAPPVGEEPVRAGALALPPHPLYSVGAVLALGLVSLACWLFEVIQIKGWAGLAWLHGFPRAALPICVCVALSVAVPVVRRTRPSAWRFALFMVLGAGVALLSFSITRTWFYGGTWPGVAVSWWDVVGSPLTSIALMAFGMHLLIRLLLGKISHWNVLLLAVAPFLVLGLSIATIEVVPAINGNRDFIHAVKMGYPTFWVNVLLAAAVELAMRLPLREERNRSGPAA